MYISPYYTLLQKITVQRDINLGDGDEAAEDREGQTRGKKIGNGEIYQPILSKMVDLLQLSVAHAHACASHKK